MYLIVLLAVFTQSHAAAQLTNLTSLQWNKCPLLFPSLGAATKMPFSMYENFVPNTTEYRNIDSICYRMYPIKDNFYIAQQARLNSTGALVQLKFSLIAAVSSGLNIISPGFQSNIGIFSQTALDFSGCASKLYYSCSPVGNVTGYASAITTVLGQRFDKCADKATSLLSGRGLKHPNGFISLPQKHIYSCLYNVLIG